MHHFICFFGKKYKKSRLERADFCVVLPGFEPRQAEPKTAVLPLHHKTILSAQETMPFPKALQSYKLFSYSTKFFLINFSF